MNVINKLIFYLGLCSLSLSINATPITVGFESFGPQSPAFSGHPAEEVLALPFLTLSGGVILDDDYFRDADPVGENIYATTDITIFAPVGLTGNITGAFSGTVDSILLSVINGYYAATFTLTAFNDTGSIVDTTTLSPFWSSSFIGSLSVFGSGITSFSVTTNQSPGRIDFAIDDLKYNVSSIPEPATLALMGVGLAGFGYKRRKQMLMRK